MIQLQEERIVLIVPYNHIISFPVIDVKSDYAYRHTHTKCVKNYINQIFVLLNCILNMSVW